MVAILYYSLYYNPTHQYNLKYYTVEVKYNVILALNNLIGQTPYLILLLLCHWQSKFLNIICSRTIVIRGNVTL
jgi:hypothetical protein